MNNNVKVVNKFVLAFITIIDSFMFLDILVII